MTASLRPKRAFRWIASLVLASLLVIAAMVILARRRTAMASARAPIDFGHSIHLDSGVSCLFCHSNAMRSDRAGIPSVQKCMGCHRTIATESPEIQALAGYWERQEPIPWQGVTALADFVFFSHQPHVLAGTQCETCHGPVGSDDVVRPAEDMDMGWCLDCHLDQPEEKVARLVDCLACHK